MIDKNDEHTVRKITENFEGWISNAATIRVYHVFPRFRDSRILDQIL